MNIFKKNEGFTLVELIVVIAILAILSGVAVPAYSGYITKTNMTADQTMVADLEKALTLGYYSGELNGNSGYVILSTEGVVNVADIAEGSTLDKVLTATYGDDWANFLVLKYADWNSAFPLPSVEEATTVANSSYSTGSTPTELMGTVSSLTNSVASALGSKTDAAAAIKSNVSVDSWNTVTQQLGITDTSKLSNTELSNLALLLVADEMSKDDYDMENASILAQVVSAYALYSGYAYSEYATPEDKIAFENITNSLVNIPEGTTDVTDYVFEQLGGVDNFSEDALQQYAPEEGDSAAANDLSAFAAMMATLNKGSTSLDASDLSNASLTTDGAVGDYFNQYMDAVNVVAGMGDDVVIPTVNAGEVAVIFSGFNVYSTID